MSEETPNVDQLKAEERLKIDVPIEEEPVKAESGEKGSVDVAAEMRSLGRQMMETLQTAWNSDERQRFEKEVREGMRSFADEIDKVIQEVRENEKTEKVRTEASQVAEKVTTSDVGQKARGGFVKSLQWLSEELGVLANRLTPGEESAAEPVEKSPEDVG